MIANTNNDNLDPSRWIVVPFVPYRCPNCDRHRVKTLNSRGRVRQHVCLACGTRYKSYELPAGSVAEWDGEIPSDE